MVPERQAVVYQEHRLLPWRHVWEDVAIGLPRASSRPRAFSALEEVGLRDRHDAWPSQLSGGPGVARRSRPRSRPRSRTAPPRRAFAALDALTPVKVHGLLRMLWERHQPAVIMVTHDVDEAAVLADQVLVIDDGRIAHELPIGILHPRGAPIRSSKPCARSSSASSESMTTSNPAVLS